MATRVTSINRAMATDPWPYRLRQLFTVRRVVIALTVLVLLYLVLVPLLMLLLTSAEDTSNGVTLTGPYPWSGVNFQELLDSSGTGALLLRTLIYALGSLVVALVLGFFFAWLVERTDIIGKRVLYVLVVAPIGIPSLVFAIAWSLLLNPTNGTFNVWLRQVLGLHGSGPINVYTLLGMILVEGIASVPLTFMLLSVSLRNMNSNMDEAARMSGAGFWRSLLKIQLPLLAPVLLGVAAYQFCLVIEGTDVPLTLGLTGGVDVLSVHTYLLLNPSYGLPDYGGSSVYGIILLLLALIPTVIYNRLISQSGRFVTVTGKTFRANKVQIGYWRIPALIVCCAYVLLSFVAPLAILIWTSLLPYIRTPSLSALHLVSLSGFSGTFHNPVFWPTLLRTLEMGMGATLAAMIISVAAAWIVARVPGRLRWLVDMLAFLPHTFPAPAVGLAVLVLYLVLPIPVYGTIWILVIAMATKFVSIGTRTTSSALVQMHPALEEAAEVSGARGLSVWRRVLGPLLRPALLSSGFLIFMGAIKNLTLPLILSTQNSNQVLSTLIWSEWSGSAGNPTSAAVMGLTMVVITICATVGLLLVRERAEA